MQYSVKENGQTVAKVIQSGLGTFVKILDAYLTGIGAALHLDKFSQDEHDDQKAPC